MASKAADIWNTVRRADLDQLLHAHQRVGGNRRGRRYATQQLNHAYLVAISAQFQGFCRDLHSEAVSVLAAVDPRLSTIISASFTKYRKLDHGNPNEGNIAEDFTRIGMESFWDRVSRRGGTVHTKARRRRLEQMNAWRNAIAHHSFEQNVTKLDKLDGRLEPRLIEGVRCRNACDQLVRQLDEAVGAFLGEVVGVSPW